MLSAALVSFSAAAQDITGTVFDTEGNPMPGASVYWADTNVGTATSMEGKFRLHRVRGYDKLVTTFLGYTNDTLRVDDSMSAVEIRLRADKNRNARDADRKQQYKKRKQYPSAYLGGKTRFEFFHFASLSIL